MKNFIKFYVAMSRGKIKQQPSADLVNIFAEWFFAGFTHVTRTPTYGDERSEA
jgi:hypothetical protein